MDATQSTTPVARLAMITAVVASLLFVTFLVVSTSRAAFTDTTDNTVNTVAAGDVVLTDDDSGTALFTTSGMAATNSVTECIEVTYDGTIVPTNSVRFYNNAAITGTGLDQYLDVVIEEGTGGAFGACGAFAPNSTIYTGSTLQSFGGTHTGWVSGLDTTWTPAAQGETRTFRVTLTLQDNNAAQGLDATFGFTWEAQS